MKINKITFILLVVCMLFIKCSHNTTVYTISDNNCFTDTSSISQFDSTKFSAFNPNLTNEIKDYITKYCNLKEEKIILVWLEEESNSSFLYMVSNYFFIKERLKGYSIIDDKMIAFYGSVGEVNGCLLDTNKLIIGYPENYPDETSDIAYTWDYDPKFRKYKIVNADSLVLVYEGY